MDVKKGRMGRGKAKKDWKYYECGADELFQRLRVLISLRTPVGFFFVVKWWPKHGIANLIASSLVFSFGLGMTKNKEKAGSDN